jgi:hypothetical protein
MPQHTPIPWCDSAVNLMMGCDVCEMWNPAVGVRACYAGVMTENRAGRPGWPESFGRPSSCTAWTKPCAGVT